MLQINDLTYRIAGRVLFDRASVTVPAGHRAGLVGPNGSGKTTLLRLIAGELQPDDGAIVLPPRWRVGTVAQEAPGGPETLLDTVLAADRERHDLLAEAETADDPHRIAEVHTRLADIDAHAAPARAAAILAGLGFDEAAQARPCRDLSGGMRMRVALAATLFRQPELLLLDEPTNHLDLESTLWLEGFLKAYPHTIVLVSHDRDLLNRAVEGIVHLDGGRLKAYGGNWDKFQETLRLEREQQAAQAAKQEARRRHLQSFVDRFRYKATKARQAQSRIKALEKMQPVEVVGEGPAVRFNLPQPEPLAPPIVALDGASAGYDGRPVLRGLTLRVDMDDRIALLGANGNGKSTLVKLLARRLEPMAGTVAHAPKLRVGYFAQHQTDELDPARSALAEAMAWWPNVTQEKARSHLGRFGFAQARAETRVGALSGGEKARLLLALMTREAPHLLLLDEPTNHLDVASREALVEALNGYEGAVVLITHDPHLVRLTADRLWLVADGTCRPFDGDLDDYRDRVLSRARADRGAARAEKRADRAEKRGDGDAPVRGKDQRRAAAETRAAQAPLRRRAQEAEREIARLEREKAALERRMADPAVYDGPADQVTRLQIALHDVATRLAEAEDAWLEASAALEEAG